MHFSKLQIININLTKHYTQMTSLAWSHEDSVRNLSNYGGFCYFSSRPFFLIIGGGGLRDCSVDSVSNFLNYDDLVIHFSNYKRGILFYFTVWCFFYVAPRKWNTS